MTSQKQSGGDESLNFQVGGSMTLVRVGLTIDEAKEIALALVRPEFDKLLDVAMETARARSDDMINNRLLPLLEEKNPDGFKTFADPDVQYALLAAQRTYARTGDSELADVLVDILVDRTKELDRSLLQISLTEALDVAGKLTRSQFAILSLVWLIRYSLNSGIEDRASLREYIDTHLAPHLAVITATAATFQHLDYAGCARLGVNQWSIETHFRTSYAGLFSRGFSEEQLAVTFGGVVPEGVRQIITSCTNNPELLQVDVMNESSLPDICLARGIDASALPNLIQLVGAYSMSELEVKTYLEETHPAMAQLIDLWSTTSMCISALTSVGIVIAHANARRVMGESPGDISDWFL